MNVAAVARVLSGFVLFFSLAQIVPLLVALSDRADAPRFADVDGFCAGIGVGLAVGVLLWLAGVGRPLQFFRREGLAVVGLAWVAAGALGALPLTWSGALHDTSDALFEAISGLTTTGASVFGSHDNPGVEDLPRSLLLWRAMLHWMGGMGIILVFVVLLPAMGVTGKNLLSSEQVGVADHSQRPRLQEQARALFTVYVVLTTADVLLLWLAGMDDLFEATCHAFATMATGGFSTRARSIGAYQSLPVEMVTVLFMLFAGGNFLLWLEFARNGFRRPRALLRNPELRSYFALAAGLVLAVALILWSWGGEMVDRAADTTKNYASFATCVRDSAFNVVSILTSTGFATADFQNWPKAALLLLVLCMVIGGCTSSTAGGVKVLRVLVSGKLIGYTVRHFLRPKSVEKVKVGTEVVPNSAISAMVALVLMWLVSIALGALVLALDGRLDLVSSVTASVSMMGCTGPAITDVVAGAEGCFAVDNLGGLDLGPCGSYGDLHPLAKLVMALQMILGRLEILAPMVLFLPGLWRR